MKRAFLAASCLLLLVSASAFAQRHPTAAPGAGVVNVSGAVRGQVGADSFTLASGRGTFLVNASKATIRFRGKFFALRNITPGSFVVAHGALRGTTIMATSVEVTRLAGLKIPARGTMTPPKRGGGKGDSKKGTTGGGAGKSG